MPNDAPPDSLDEHRHFLTNVLNNLTNCEAYQKQRPMKVQSYTPLLSSMLSLLEKMRNQPTMDQLQATINQIKNTTEQTLTKVTYVERKQDTARTTPTTSSAATTGYKRTITWAERAAFAASAPTISTLSGTSIPAPILEEKAREIVVKLNNEAIAKDLAKLASSALKDRINAAISNALKDHNNTRIPTNQNAPAPPISNGTAKAAAVAIAARVLPSGDLQVIVNNASDTERLRKDTRWAIRLSSKATIIQPSFGLIAHFVPANLSMTDIKERLWEENKSHMPVRNRVTGVEWLSRTSKAGATARSMVVYFENELDCNAILASQLYLDGRSFAVERHVPEARLRQCFRCGKYGHTSHACRQKHQTCFKCSESHHMTDCKSVTLKCNACGKEGHGASAESCPERKKEKARMKRAKEEALPFWPLRASSRETLNGQEQERSSPPASTTPTVTTSSEVTPASTQVEQGPRTGSVREKDWQTVPTLRKGKKRAHGEVDPLADNPSSTNRSMAQAASKKGKKKPSSKAVEVLSDKENDDSSSMTTRSATRRLQPSTQTEEEL